MDQAFHLGQDLRNAGWNVTRPMVPGTGNSPGEIDNVYNLTPRQ
jgi:hypothetical protein